MSDNFDFFNQFDRVFNKDFSIKSCGRDETRLLIKICNQIESSTDFGNVDTGFMNIDNILKLYQSLTITI